MTQDKLNGAAFPTSNGPVDERFIGLIPDVYRWTAWGGKDRFNVAVTDKRLIFDLVTDKTPPWDDYPQKNSGEILAMNKKNVAIPIDTITSLRFILGESLEHTCGRHEEVRGEMRIQTIKAKYSFYVPNRFERSARELLKKAGLSLEEIRPERLAGI